MYVSYMYMHSHIHNQNGDLSLYSLNEIILSLSSVNTFTSFLSASFQVCIFNCLWKLYLETHCHLMFNMLKNTPTNSHANWLFSPIC